MLVVGDSFDLAPSVLLLFDLNESGSVDEDPVGTGQECEKDSTQRRDVCIVVALQSYTMVTCIRQEHRIVQTNNIACPDKAGGWCTRRALNILRLDSSEDS